MILPASYLNGFAPRDGQPLYPSLWKGCCGAWNPGLGPSGLVLRDNSGLGNNGTLTNGPTFAASQGKYAMNFDGTDDFVDAGTGVSQSFDLAKAFTASVWVNPSLASGGNGNAIIGRIESYAAGLNGFLLTYRSGGAALLIANASTYNEFFGQGIITLNRWQNVIVWFNGTSFGCSIDGINVYTAAASISLTYRVGDTLRIGKGTGATIFRGLMDDVRVYNRALSLQEIRTLATRRGIAYEMAPRRRSSVQVTTNRRRRIIIGGNR